MTITKEIDFDARYSVEGYKGIAFYLIGYATINEPVICFCQDEDGNEYEQETGEYEQVEDKDYVIAVMVGDNRKHKVSIDDITPLSEEDYCHVCGQIGCKHDGR